MSKEPNTEVKMAPSAENGAQPAEKQHMTMIEFGGIESVGSAVDYINIGYDTYLDYYIPPVSRFALAKIANIATYHGAVLRARTNMVSNGVTHGGGLTHAQMRVVAHNLLQFGDAAILKVRDSFRRIVRLEPLSSLYMRRRRNGKFVIVQRSGNKVYRDEDIIFLAQYDPQQQIYGLPDYLGGLQSAMLNTDATRFRRKYYQNGAHLGYILYSTDPDMTPEFEDELRKKIAESKGAGNFRSMFINIPNGKPEGVKIIPVGDVSTKDEFLNIKNISAQDQLVAHRFPAGLAGIIPPQNSGGLGDPLKYREAYQLDEIIPMQNLITEAINGAGLPERLHVAFNRPNKPTNDA